MPPSSHKSPIGMSWHNLNKSAHWKKTFSPIQCFARFWAKQRCKNVSTGSVEVCRPDVSKPFSAGARWRKIMKVGGYRLPVKIMILLRGHASCQLFNFLSLYQCMPCRLCIMFYFIMSLYKFGWTKLTRAGLEPATSGLTCRGSTNWAIIIGGLPILSISLFGGASQKSWNHILPFI